MTHPAIVDPVQHHAIDKPIGRAPQYGIQQRRRNPDREQHAGHADTQLGRIAPNERRDERHVGRNDDGNER